MPQRPTEQTIVGIAADTLVAVAEVFKKFWRYGALILSCECQKRIIM